MSFARRLRNSLLALLVAAAVCASVAVAQSPQRTRGGAKNASTPPAATTAPRHITSPKEFFGFNIGDDYHLVNYTDAVKYWQRLAQESDRMKLVDIGMTFEGRHQYMAILSAPENIQNLDHYEEISRTLARAEGIDDAQAHRLAQEGKAVVWIDGGLHSDETVGFSQLIEVIYELNALTDEETLRLLHDDIVLCVPINPDGSELVANWYNRITPPENRVMGGLPKLYNRYIGHDDNRDSFMSNMPETANANRVLYTEWFPQILYNHHQTGPAGSVIFMPPFRDPFNYEYDPLVPVGIEEVASAMHARLIAHGMPGSAMRASTNYSTWFNGNIRTTSYFHNMIGILTEIIGEPTPIAIPLVPEKELPSGDWPWPIAPQPWHYQQSIDYEMQNDRAVLDYASRNRETLLFNIYRMGKNSIERGSEDYWTITPDRIDALREAAAKMAATSGGRGRGGAAAGGAAAGFGGRGGGAVPTELYDSVLHNPANRDPRGYIIPSDQVDFATATKFVNVLLKNGIEVDRATADFQVAGKSYPAGSFVVKTAQAARPFVLDMFQPQHHPNDFQYPGGPPIPPYDIAGWTVAMQMDIQFDRVYDGFDGPFTQLPYSVLPMPTYSVSEAATPAGYLINHQIDNSVIVVNRLLKAGCDVYWLKAPQQIDGKDAGPGAIWVPASATATPIVRTGAAQLGVPAQAETAAPTGAAYKLQPVRVGLYDQYGGSMPSGWVRWMFEQQFEVPVEVVYPPNLDAGNLKSKYDVLVFVDSGTGAMGGAGRGGRGGGGGRGGRGGLDLSTVPEPYRSEMGSMTADKTLPQLKAFLQDGGSIVTIGSATGMAHLLGVPVADYLTEMDADGVERPLPQEKFYIPGSLMRITVDPTDPLAYGMPSTLDAFFDASPVFRIVPDAHTKVTSVAWFNGKTTLDSGWAWGQAYLDGGVAVAEAPVGKGKVFLFGPEITFRGQPHGTFKFLFNALYYGSATETTLQ